MLGEKITFIAGKCEHFAGLYTLPIGIVHKLEVVLIIESKQFLSYKNLNFASNSTLLQ